MHYNPCFHFNRYPGPRVSLTLSSEVSENEEDYSLPLIL